MLALTDHGGRSTYRQALAITSGGSVLRPARRGLVQPHHPCQPPKLHRGTSAEDLSAVPTITKGGHHLPGAASGRPRQAEEEARSQQPREAEMETASARRAVTDCCLPPPAAQAEPRPLRDLQNETCRCRRHQSRVGPVPAVPPGWVQGYPCTTPGD